MLVLAIFRHLQAPHLESPLKPDTRNKDSPINTIKNICCSSETFRKNNRPSKCLLYLHFMRSQRRGLGKRGNELVRVTISYSRIVLPLALDDTRKSLFVCLTVFFE